MKDRLLQKIILQVLMNTTAKAFRARPKTIWTHPAEQALKEYAAYTQRLASLSEADPQRLYRMSYELAQKVRKLSGYSSEEDLYRLLFFLYRNIGITLNGNIHDGFIFSDCYFSRVYDPKTCALMSAMDSGIIAGLFQNGTLCFTQRITEGCPQCRACFQITEDV